MSLVIRLKYPQIQLSCKFSLKPLISIENSSLQNLSTPKDFKIHRKKALPFYGGSKTEKNVPIRDILSRGRVLEDVLGLEGTFWSPWSWPRSLKSSKVALSSARRQHYFLNCWNFFGKHQKPGGKFTKTFFVFLFWGSPRKKFGGPFFRSLAPVSVVLGPWSRAVASLGERAVRPGWRDFGVTSFGVKLHYDVKP